MNIDYASIGANIREARNVKGWTQAELAERSGIEPSNISHIERAATKLSLPTLFSIANALNATLDELVYGNLLNSRCISCQKLDALLEDCTDDELEAIVEIVRTTKTILQRRRR